MPILDHFGLAAPIYDRLFQPAQPGTLIGLLGLPVQGRILDAGGGTGRVAQALVQYAGEVIVADVSHRMLMQANGKSGLTTVQCAAEALPFGSGSFDRIIMVDAFHHVADQPRTIGELWRALKPGGRLIIEEPDIRALLVKLVALIEKVTLMRSHFQEPDDIARLFGTEPSAVQVHREDINAWIVVDKCLAR